jgi:hypothetical protein
MKWFVEYGMPELENLISDDDAVIFSKSL